MSRWRLAVILVAVTALAFLAYATFSARPKLDSKTGEHRTASPVPVVTRPVDVVDFPLRRRTIGTFESPAIVVIRSRIDSQVLEQHVTDGQIVKKGDLLFTLDDREIKATIARDQAQIVKDQAALTQAEAALKRTQELISKHVAPQQQLEQATATFKAAQQTVEADQAVVQADELRMGYARLEAPITGRLGAIRVAPGNLVSSNDTAGLVTLTQMQPLRVSFTLPEGDLAALRKAASQQPPATVRAYFSGDDGRPAAGILDFVDSSVDTATGTIAAKATFQNEHFRLWPGQYVDIEVDLAVMPRIVTIPTVAIQSGQQGPYVFLAKPDARAEMRRIELAVTDGGVTAIKSGLSAGDRVVIQGQLRLTNGARWQEADASAALPDTPKASAPAEAAASKRNP